MQKALRTTGASKPRGQKAHFVLELSTLYFPFVQSMQEIEPCLSANRPGKHGKQLICPVYLGTNLAHNLCTPDSLQQWLPMACQDHSITIMLFRKRLSLPGKQGHNCFLLDSEKSHWDRLCMKLHPMYLRMFPVAVDAIHAANRCLRLAREASSAQTCSR